MKALEFTAGGEQKNELQALAYWTAESAYCLERFGAGNEEHERARKTIGLIFSRLDRLQVPFWVQNAVVFWAQDWRRYAGAYLAGAMEKRGIFGL